MKCFTENFRGCSAHLKKLQNKEKSEKCEINCRPSVLRSPQLVLVCLVNGRQEPFGFSATRPHVSYIFGKLMTNGMQW